MKKTLLFSKIMMVFLQFAAWNVSAQDYYFTESFLTGETPAGWEVKDVSYSDGTHAPNQLNPDALFSAKMKTNNLTTWIMFPKVNGVTDLIFWCKVRDPEQNPVVVIQSSEDGTTWSDIISSETGITGLDLTNIDDFQEVSIPLNVDGEVYIRLYVSADGGTSSKGMLYVDDIRLGKPQAAADDVSLINLSVGGILIEGFDFNKTEYTMEVSHAKDYTVTAVANNPNATVEITQVSDINGDEAARTATVFVTGEDGSSTSTTTIVFTQTDYWYKTGFIGKTEGLEDWERNSVFQDDTPPYPSLDLYPGEATLRFTAGPITDPGRLISPKLPNMGTLSFYASAEVVFDEHQLNVYLKTSDTDSTLVKSITGQNLTYEWQEVVVTIESFDSVQIIIEGICDINDDNTSRIHMDDFLLTYYDPEFLPDDVTLLSLSVGGDLIEGFDPAITSYAMEISPIADYTVTAEPLNPDATVEINQLSDLNGDEAARTATIVVTSADGSTTATITIVFRTPNSFVSDFNADEIILYPNPATGLLNIEVPANAYKLVQIFNLSGQKVMEHVIASDQIILNIENLSKGLFILSFTGNEGSTKTKFVKK